MSESELQTLCEKSFSSFADKCIPTRFFHPLKQYQPCIIKLPLPNNENYMLKLNWVLPSVFEHNDSAPLTPLASLLIAQSPNSLVDHLLKQGWIASPSGLKAGFVYNIPSFSLFRVQVTLTRSGYANYATVLHYVFQHINLIKSHRNIQFQFYSQCIKMREMNWQMIHKSDFKVQMYVKKLARHLHSITKMNSDFLKSFHGVILNEDPEESCRWDDQIRVDNVQVQLSGPSFDTAKLKVLV